MYVYLCDVILNLYMITDYKYVGILIYKPGH